MQNNGIAFNFPNTDICELNLKNLRFSVYYCYYYCDDFGTLKINNVLSYYWNAFCCFDGLDNINADSAVWF